MSKHTPGPWTVRYAKNITAIGTTKGEMQLSLHGVYDGLKPLSVDVHEWQANANLIAAAPAMYEALKFVMVATADWPSGLKASIEVMRAQCQLALNLAQAEGQQL